MNDAPTPASTPKSSAERTLLLFVGLAFAVLVASLLFLIPKPAEKQPPKPAPLHRLERISVAPADAPSAPGDIALKVPSDFGDEPAPEKLEPDTALRVWKAPGLRLQAVISRQPDPQKGSVFLASYIQGVKAACPEGSQWSAERLEPNAAGLIEGADLVQAVCSSPVPDEPAFAVAVSAVRGQDPRWVSLVSVTVKAPSSDAKNAAERSLLGLRASGWTTRLPKPAEPKT